MFIPLRQQQSNFSHFSQSFVFFGGTLFTVLDVINGSFRQSAAALENFYKDYNHDNADDDDDDVSLT